ncbi:MAG: Hpt domain-containing protein [Anaerolineae bacterium]|nr:Hpt domain-containing protein [Anaerolineae bacterium]
MSDDLLNIFREEVTDHLAGLNDALLKVEMSAGAEQAALLREMNRLAHSMKGAARAVGYGLVETVSHYLEEIFHAVQQARLTLSPEVADALYDSLDLIQTTLDGTPPEQDAVAEILGSLERLVAVAGSNPPPTNGQKAATPPPRAAPPKKAPPPKKTAKRATGGSEELPVITPPPPPPAAPRQFTTPAATDSSLMHIFREEMEEHLAGLNDALLKVEMSAGAEQAALLREMNRLAHSMKGAARAVGYGLIEAISHHLEEIFHACLHKGLALTPELADALYDGLDLIQSTMQDTATDPDMIDQVLAALEHITPPPGNTLQARAITPPALPVVPPPALLQTTLDPVPAPPPAAPRRVDKTPRASDTAEIRAVSGGLARETTTSTGERTIEAEGTGSTTQLLRPPEETVRVAVSKLDTLLAETSELLVARMQGEARQAAVHTLRRLHARWRREWRTVRTAYIRLARRLQDQATDSAGELGILFKFLQSSEDYLNSTGRELAQLAGLMSGDNMHLATLADNLQTSVSSLRMMPFETIVGGFQRMVRDLARDTGKQIQLEVSGAAVEIDKIVLDALKDPLLHLLRNAIDHGIETPAARTSAGKAPVGHIRLGVEQRGTEIVIQVADDGGGLNLGRIRRKAAAVGLLTEAEADALPDDEARLLIFQSGFSTSDSVTAISGRGLGMDIVRDRVESLRGRISVHSSAGHGTSITLSVPVSLTRIRAVLLRVGEEDYALPSTMILRMQTLSTQAIFTAEGREMILVNERPMPLVSLGALLDIPGSSERGSQLTIVAVQSAERAIAFEVDALYSELELVLKPLGRELENAPLVAGAALLGSGEVVIILDANDLVRKASGVALPLRRRVQPGSSRAEARRLRVLVVDDSITTRTLEKNILEAVGFEVFVAINGSEAWDMLLEVTPDVIVSDVEMPVMNGLELARRVKNHAATRDIPLILLTSLGKPEQREEGLRAGADAYLVKSRFDQGELLETIRSVM